MSGISEELRDQIRTIVAEVLEADPAALTDDSSFADDFEADSLLVIEMYARFERDLKIKIPQDAVVELDDLPATYALLAEHTPAEAARV
ncbi:acyl carrier protein [Streptomyces sp. NPDC048595]|uniref:acyl carrier protein n=1 Tax=Streptomyces sp. NPDC048595 TaxID=3365576 RepID=UPI00371AAD77